MQSSDIFIGLAGYGFNVSTAGFLACAIAALTVFLLIFGRYEIRLRRLRMIRDYADTFPNTLGIERIDDMVNPSFEFVRAKYSADINVAPPAENETRRSATQQIDAVIEAARRFGNYGDIRFLIASLGYLLAVYAGFKLTFLSVSCHTEDLQKCLAAPLFGTLFNGGACRRRTGGRPKGSGLDCDQQRYRRLLRLHWRLYRLNSVHGALAGSV